MMQSNSNVPVTNIGSANVYQGSQIATLNTIPANSNITFKADDEPFNLYVQTVLDNTYLNSTFETFSVTSSNISATNETSSYTFQFNYPNWGNTRDAFLEWPVEIFTSTLTPPSDQDSIGPDPMNINTMFSLDYASANDLAYLKNANFLSGQFPNEAIIQMFKSFQVYGATNNQPLGKTTMFDQPNLSTIALMEKENNLTATINGFSGLPISSVKFRPTIFGKTAVAANAGPFDSTALGNSSPRAMMVNENAAKAFEATVRSCSRAIAGSTVAPDGTTGLIFSNKVIVSIPLWKISEWFRTNKCIPPEFRFKLTLTFYNAQKTLYVGTNRSQYFPAYFYMRPNTLISPVIKTRTFVLNPTVQEALNLKWARNVFTYNLETAEPFVIPASAYPYRTVIQTSQQRPLLLRICVHALADTPNPEPETPLPVRYFQNSLVPWLDKDGNNISITEISVYISGKTVIRYENDAQNQNGWMPTGFENLISLYNQKNGQCYSSQPGNNQSSFFPVSFANAYSGVPIDIPLAASMLWDNSCYPTDQGAIQITLNIKTTAALDPNFQITVYKIYTQQTSVDTNLKATLTEWPARVVQNQGENSTLVQPNVIPGN